MHSQVFVLLTISVAVFSSQIQTNTDLFTSNLTPIQNNNSLGFPNFSGSCITSDMRAKITQIVNDASDYQGDNIPNNLKYIKQQIDIRYGSLDEQFSISIQLKDQTGFFNVLSTDKCSVMSIKAGSNELFPEWSYLIYKTKRSTSNFIYQDGTGTGIGITSQQRYDFVHIIKSIQPPGICDCGSTADIWKTIYQKYQQNWNLICSKTYSNRMYIGVNNNQYITVAFNCVYNIYAGYTDV